MSIPVYHQPIVKTVVVARNEKGRPTLVEHRCKECGRLVTQGRHTG